MIFQTVTFKMIFLHRPRNSWDLNEVQFNRWQSSIERHVQHVLDCHLEHHDDQKPGEPKEKISFNGDHKYQRVMNLVFDT